MHRLQCCSIVVLLACTAAACGAPPGPFRFKANDFEIAPGAELYQCFVFNHPTGGADDAPVGIKRVTVAASGAHVHHVVVFTDSFAEVDANRECSLMEAGWNWRYAAGVGTDPLVLPPGSAIPVKARETIVLQFHYLNATLVPIKDTTTIDIEFTAPGEEFTAADLFVVGTSDFTIPARTDGFVTEGRCTVPDDVAPTKVLAWFPHMHQLGRNIKVERIRGGEVTLIHDGEFGFSDQPMFYAEPGAEVEIAAGDEIVTTCTFDNAGDEEVAFGESSNEEMCFNFMTVFPAPTPGQSLNCF